MARAIGPRTDDGGLALPEAAGGRNVTLDEELLAGRRPLAAPGRHTARERHRDRLGPALRVGAPELHARPVAPGERPVDEPPAARRGKERLEDGLVEDLLPERPLVHAMRRELEATLAVEGQQPRRRDVQGGTGRGNLASTARAPDSDRRSQAGPDRAGHPRRSPAPARTPDSGRSVAVKRVITPSVRRSTQTSSAARADSPGASRIRAVGLLGGGRARPRRRLRVA